MSDFEYALLTFMSNTGGTATADMVGANFWAHDAHARGRRRPFVRAAWSLTVLARSGLVERVLDGSPATYRVTHAGYDALLDRVMEEPRSCAS